MQAHKQWYDGKIRKEHDPHVNQLYRIDHLHFALAQGILILTPNRRIAEKIKQAWSELHLNQPIAVPDVHAADDWLHLQWKKLLSTDSNPKKKLLSSIESILLWEQVIDNIEHGLLMPTDAIADLVSRSDHVLCQWCIAYQTLPDDPDSQLLKNAIRVFEKRLDEKNATTIYRCHALLSKAFAEKKMAPPEEIILTGFDDIPPLLQRVLTSTAAHIKSLAATTQNPETERITTATAEQEIVAAATWALQQLPASVGIIIPDLNNRRNEIERILQSVFEPQYVLPEIARYSAPFNISAGEPLTQQTVITTALQLLALNNTNASLQDFLTLLHSVFWGDYSNELENRITAELELREKQWDDLTLADFRHSFIVHGSTTQSSLVSRLNNFEKVRIKNKNKRFPSEWIEIIQQQLSILGWPGTRRLDSIEFQQVSSFQEILDQLIALDDLLGKMDYLQILRILQTLCRKTLFHAQTKESPIQVLGLLEGSGLHFDALWLCGMSETSWPPSPAPNPLLPLTLQIEKQMPHCSTEREQHYAKQISERLIQSAPKIIISHPQKIDEPLQRPSHLFSHIKETTMDALIKCSVHEHHPYFTLLARNHSIELVQDSQGPVFTNAHTRGGQALLKMQAANPFDAFSRYRLDAKILPEVLPGLAPHVRGNLIHSCLQNFWNKIRSHTELIQLSYNDRGKIISDSVDAAIRKNDHPALLIENFRRIETVQLNKHLAFWMKLEEQRAPFHIVALEKSIKTILNGVELSLKIDRIDQLSDGRLLLIDYKTTSGNLSVNSWRNERLDEPQLPLYTLAIQSPGTDKLAGISFAQVNLENMRFISLGTSDDIPGLGKKNSLDESAWDELIQQWNRNLAKLMEEYQSGHAPVQYQQASIPDHAQKQFSLNRWPERLRINELLARKGLST